MPNTDIEQKIKTNRFFIGVILVSFMTLLLSFTSEFIFQKIPCQLCKLERLPYFGMLITGVIGFTIFDKKTPLFFLLGISLFSLSLGAYHFGIQQHIFKDFCKGSSVSTMEEYKSILHSPSCSKTDFVILGIPATIINFYLSLVFFLTAFSRLMICRNVKDISA